MPLAGQHDHIIGSGSGDQVCDGFATTGNELDLGRPGETGTDVIENAQRVFGTRVVVGDQHAIGQALGHFGHQRALAAISVAAAAEQAQQLAVRVRAQGFEHFLQGVRSMRVVDHHQRLVAPTQALHAADRPLQLRGDLQDFVQRIVQRQQGRHGGEHVAQVEAAQQLAAQGTFALGGDQGGPHAIVIEHGFTTVQRGLRVLQAVAEQPGLDMVDTRAAGKIGGQAAAEIVIQVDHLAAQARPGEQLGLGGLVGLHAAVVVQVVAGQVGHDRDVEFQRGDPALLQGMGGNLHGHGLGATFLEVVEGRLHGDRVGRGQAATLQLTIEAGTQGANQAATLAKQVQRLGHQLGNAGLAVGTGHAHQIQLAARFAIEATCDIRKLGDQALDRDERHIGDRQDPGTLLFVGHGGGATGQGIGDMLAAIDLGARHGQEQITRAHIAAVQGQFTDQRVTAGVSEKLAQWHCHHPRPPLAVAAALTCDCSTGAGGGRLSGGTFIRRRVPDMTLLNTGAETRPPK